MTTRRRAPETWMTRVWSTLGVVLVVLAQTASLVHDGAVRHARCAEHGELVELSTSAAVHAPLRQDSVETIVAAQPDGGHEHDHCLLALHRASSSACAARVVLAKPLYTDLVTTSTRRASEARTSLALLRAAPKTSPPASSIS